MSTEHPCISEFGAGEEFCTPKCQSIETDTTMIKSYTEQLQKKINKKNK
jgi:hypothetical protein